MQGMRSIWGKIYFFTSSGHLEIKIFKTPLIIGTKNMKYFGINLTKNMNNFYIEIHKILKETINNLNKLKYVLGSQNSILGY